MIHPDTKAQNSSVPTISRLRFRVALVFVFLGMAVLVYHRITHIPPPAPKPVIFGLQGPETPAAPDVLRLLDDLRPGDKLGDGTVLAIDAPVERIVWVDVQLGSRVFGIGVGATGTGGDKPMPITTDKYEVRHGMLRGEGEFNPQAMQQAAEQLAARIRRREQTVPLPSGM